MRLVDHQGKNKRVVWILDSGCSRHMTGDIALLSQFEEKHGLWVILEDDVSYEEID